jgi:membrane-bound serine protease (ClpP class)
MTGLIVALLVLGAALVVVEAHLPTYGALGLAGIAMFVAAVVLALAAAGAGVAVAIGVGLAVGAAATAAGLVVVRKALAVRGQRARCGAEGLVGHVGVVRRPLDPLGQVFVDGELWRARRSWAEEDEPPPREGEPVLVERVQGLTLSVRRAEAWEVEL